ncbi:MAG: DsbA family protein [Actinomycetota bacterium]|nr:DsbA family protein [Actinomycetota bacterium]
MTDSVRFHFDPLCPWCYQTSRWVQRLAELGEITVDWAVFSLEIVNAGSAESAQKGHARSEPGLRTVIAVRDAEGADAVGRFYAALGAAVHQRGEAVDDHATIARALTEANLAPELLDKALADDSTWIAVQDEHRALVDGTRSFGVPTIVLDGGDGPAIFGPVISDPPDGDADAVELWHHVAWLTRYENFSELKRERSIQPDLPSFRR